MGRVGWLLFLVTAPLLGTCLAIADLVLGLRGAVVAAFVVLCVMALAAIGVVALLPTRAEKRQEDRLDVAVRAAR